MIPVRQIIYRAFHDSKSVDVRATLIVTVSMSMLWYLAISTSTFIDLRRSAELETRLKQDFPASTLITGIYCAGVLMGVAIVLGTYVEHDPVWIQSIGFIFPVISFYGWPRTIHCEDDYLWQRTRWGSRRRILYSEVEAISYSEGLTTVYGGGGPVIHSPYHSAVEQFHQLLAERTGKEVNYDGTNFN